jgi:hypothetical protein
MPKLNLGILGKETGRHSYSNYEHSTSTQIFEIQHFEFKSKLRMLHLTSNGIDVILGMDWLGECDGINYVC